MNNKVNKIYKNIQKYTKIYKNIQKLYINKCSI